ncbi:lysozyme-like [Epargyreus clarus]|uniref:lysozyme-like n=1 Tax=Epargyreus clarus TaxID=520877 RepID=UPI003C2FA902
MLRIVVLVLLLNLFIQSECKQFTRCGLVYELRRQGFPEAKMRDWVCLVEKESQRTTNIVSKPNKDGSRDYGLFQINDKYWCSKTSTPGKDCNITCRSLLSNDITVASTCAKKIFKRHGFRAWYGWLNHCQTNLPDISNC